MGSEALSNEAHGAGINVRGMDAGATVLLGAIERIDPLPESAPAEYGTDALAGVVNFRLRSKSLGTEGTLRAGMADGPVKERDINQLFGTRWGAGYGVLALEYYSRDALPASQRVRATSDLRASGAATSMWSGATPALSSAEQIPGRSRVVRTGAP